MEDFELDNSWVKKLEQIESKYDFLFIKINKKALTYIRFL